MILKNNKYNVIGTRPIRHDGLEKVTGKAVYSADVQLPNMSYGAILRSPYAVSYTHLTLPTILLV